MARFNYRNPNLLEVGLLIGLFITVVTGYLFISTRLFITPIAYIQTVASAIIAVFIYILLIWVGVIAIILEYQRQDLLEIKELLEKGNENKDRIRIKKIL